MSHEIHHTDALIVRTRAYAEADRMISLYTRGFGRVSALAQGVRKETSKLRFALMSGSFVRVALVRGRDVWRLTGAEAGTLRALPTREARALFRRTTHLMERLVTGEEQHEALYALMFEVREVLAAAPPLQLARLEHVIMFRLVSELGYGTTDDAVVRVHSASLSDLLAEPLSPGLERQLIRHVNEALAASHL